MEKSWPLLSLMIVGFADVVTPDTCPRVVSPIFRRGEIYLAPPYDLQAARGVLLGGLELTDAEFEQDVREQSVTRLPEPLQLTPGYVLWVGEDGVARYEPEADVLRQLGRISRQELVRAWIALINGRQDDALNHAQRAFGADDECIDALLIKAVIYHWRSDFEAMNYLIGMMINDLDVGGEVRRAVVELSEALCRRAVDTCSGD